MPRRFLLARHGQTDWNVAGRWQGQTDVPLNELGRQQARELAAAIAAAGEGIACVITSDLARAKETGAIVAAHFGLAAPRTLRELRERTYGLFEGLTVDELADKHPDAWEAWRTHKTPPEGAESIADARARMHAVIGALAAESEEPALIVTHGGVMRLWLLDVVGDQVPPLHNVITYAVDHDGGRFSARILR